jgi:hypothetical protein
MLMAQTNHVNTNQHFSRKGMVPKARDWSIKRRDFSNIKYSAARWGRRYNPQNW